MKATNFMPFMGVAFAGLVVSEPGANITTTAATAGSAASDNPCAVLSASSASYLSSRPKETKVSFTPSQVHACLQDIPINKDLAGSQIAYIQNHVQFQSTLAYLKNPPPGYPILPVDIVADLDTIANKAANGAEDGHFVYVPFLIGAFSYTRSASLVSLSLDGIQEPKVYIETDIESALAHPKTNFTPSAIISIDGQPVDQVVELLGSDAQLQDLDAQYNAVLSNPATNFPFQSYAQGLFSADLSDQYADSVTIMYENGTSSVIIALTFWSTSIGPIPGSGLDFFEKYLDNSKGNSAVAVAASSAAAASSTADTSSVSSATEVASAASSGLMPVATGYPLPLVAQGSGYMSGYFINGSDYSDFAVLNYPSFEPMSAKGRVAVQQDTQKFRALCKDAAKKYLIIDIRGNNGGVTYLAYDLFKQLFPTKVPYSGLRLRAHDSANALGMLGSSDVGRGYHTPQSEIDTSFFNSQAFLQTPDGSNYSTWQSLYGIKAIHGDNFTNTASWQFSNATLDLVDGDIVVSGYANNTNLLPQVFAGENIILLTDGQCSSTCPIFANLLIDQGQVRTVVAGGRPNNQPMAMIGGVQGGQILQYPDIKQIATDALKIYNLSTNVSGDNSSLLPSAPAMQQLITPLTNQSPINYWPATPPSINLLDNIAQGDDSETPLQFTRAPDAECRFYYMPEDMVSMLNTWERVAKGMKHGGKGLCINGTWLRSSPSSPTVAGGNPSVNTVTLPSASVGSGVGPSAAFVGGAVRSASLGFPVLLAVVALGGPVILL